MKRSSCDFAPAWTAKLLLLLGLAGSVFSARAAAPALLNVSYDVTREFYQEYNAAFARHWKQGTGETVTLRQSHGGSSAQIRSVLDGLAADVVTMNQSLDIDHLVEAHLVAPNWAQRLPHASVPYTSTILFVVRRGNPKKIHDWSDLVRPGVAVIVPNPKTSGNGRYSYLAAWGYALKRPGGNEAAAREFVRQLFAAVPVLDVGGRGATTTFAQRGIGDVLLTFENEAALIREKFRADGLEVIAPPTSIRADNPVAWVDRVVARHGNAKLARAYLEYLYSPEAQALAARHYFRPQDPALLARESGRFPALELFTVEAIAGSWAKAQTTHFADGGIFDQIYQK